MSMNNELATEELHSVAFNQDGTSVGIGTTPGYALYSTKHIEKLDRIYENHGQFEDDKKKNLHVSHVILIERLFSSSMLMLVSMKTPRRLHVYHFQKNNEICSHNYTNTVLSVKVNRDHLAVCLEEIMYIHTIKDMKVLHTIRDTPPNTAGVMDLSSTVNSYLAYPGSVTYGHVHIFDVRRLASLNTISAHTNPLAALRFSYDGTKLATASTRGTVIRVFDTETGERLFEFTRGVKRFASIYSMAFSHDAKYLASSSNTETAHVFKLEKSTVDQNQSFGSEEEQGWVDYFSKQATNYLPAQMNDLLLREKSFATAKLPSIGKRNVVALPIINEKLHLLVATTDGFVYVYAVEAEGGELTLIRQHKVGTKLLPTVHAHDGGDSHASSKEKVPEVKSGQDSGPALATDDFPPLHHSTE